MSDDPFAAMAAEFRAARARAGASDHDASTDPIGIDDNPTPPPEAYEDAVGNVYRHPRHSGPIIPAPERLSRFFNASELAGLPVPARQWLVDHLIPSKTVTLFGGDGGTGKSLVALQLAVAAATGTQWLGRTISHGRVIFISAEDDQDELHRRLADIAQTNGLDFSDLTDLTIRSLAGEDSLLAIESQLKLIETTLFAELDARAATDEPVLIVIDTLADVFPGNENDRSQARQFISILRHLALKRACAVVLLAHPSLSGLNSGAGTSGSTAWNNSVRSRLYMSRIVQDGNEPDPDRRILATKKANYGRIGGEIALTYRNGVFIEDGTPDGLDRMAIGAKAERVFMRLLRELTGQCRYVSATPSVSFAPSVFAKHPKAEGMTMSALRIAMDHLFTRGEIVVMTRGRASKMRTFVAVKGEEPAGD